MLNLPGNPAFQKRAMPLSIEAWHQMVERNLAPERSELLRGIIVEKAPKSIGHIKLAGELFALLFTTIGSRFWVRQEAPLTLGDSEPEPDISIVTGSAREYQQHPKTAKLVVEVSVSTLSEDREMATIYAEAGVEEYWIVNAADRCIEVYCEPTAGIYASREVLGLNDLVVCRSLPGVDVDVGRLFECLVLPA